MSPRMAGGVMLLAGLLAFIAAYGWLVGAWVGQSLGRLGFSAGLGLALAISLPVMAAGIHILVHGRPDVEGYESRRRVAELLREAEREGHASTHAFISRYDVPRRELRGLLADGAASMGFTGFVNWRAGRVVSAPAVAGACPACGARLPDASASSPAVPALSPDSPPPSPEGPPVCPACNVDMLSARAPGTSTPGVRDR